MSFALVSAELSIIAAKFGLWDLHLLDLSFSEKHVSGLNFFTKPSPHLFSEPNGLCGTFQGKISSDENITHFCLKCPPKLFFRKTRFWSEFFYKTVPSPIFRAKQTIWRISRQNCSSKKLRSFLPKTLPKSFFQKTRLQSEFFYETTPTPIFGAKPTMWRVSRQNCPNKDIAPFA